MQVIFAKNGSLFVNMPYYVNHEGLAAVRLTRPWSKAGAPTGPGAGYITPGEILPPAERPGAFLAGRSREL
jgi:hypothetical protein